MAKSRRPSAWRPAMTRLFRPGPGKRAAFQAACMGRKTASQINSKILKKALDNRRQVGYNIPCSQFCAALGNGVTAAPTTLTRIVKVQILVPQPFLPPLSRGLGRRPLKAETWVRIPLGVPPRKRSSDDRSCVFVFGTLELQARSICLFIRPAAFVQERAAMPVWP